MNTALNLGNELNSDNLKTLPNKLTKLEYWLKYDPRSIEEKALILFFRGGRKLDTICQLLNISHKELRTWIFDYYEKISENKKPIKEKPIYQKPNNYSEWTSSIIFKYWNQVKHKNNFLK